VVSRPLERKSLAAGQELLARIRRHHFDLMRLINAIDPDRAPDAVVKYLAGASADLDDAQDLLARLLVLEVSAGE
jgi:hypothetical protein